MDRPGRVCRLDDDRHAESVCRDRRRPSSTSQLPRRDRTRAIATSPLEASARDATERSADGRWPAARSPYQGGRRSTVRRRVWPSSRRPLSSSITRPMHAGPRDTVASPSKPPVHPHNHWCVCAHTHTHTHWRAHLFFFFLPLLRSSFVFCCLFPRRRSRST